MNNIGRKTATHTAPKGHLPPTQALKMMRLIGDSTLSANSRSALKELIDNANPAIESGKLIAFPTEETLARRIGIARRSLVPVVEELVRTGFVTLHYMTSNFRLTTAKADAQRRWHRRAYEINEHAFQSLLLLDGGERQQRQRSARQQRRTAQPGADREQNLRTDDTADREQKLQRAVRKNCNEPCAKIATNREQDLRTIVLTETELINIDLIVTENVGDIPDDKPTKKENASSLEIVNSVTDRGSDLRDSGAPSRDQRSAPLPPPPTSVHASAGPCLHLNAEPIHDHIDTWWCNDCRGPVDQHGNRVPLGKFNERRDPATMVTVKCANETCTKQWQVPPAEKRDNMLCENHAALAKRDEKRARQRRQRAA